MGGFGVGWFIGRFLSAEKPGNEPVQQADDGQRPHHPGAHFPEGVGELYLRLDVVGLEVFHVHLRFRHHQRLGGAEHQGVLPRQHRNVRQFVGAAHKGRHQQGSGDTISCRRFFSLGNQDGIHLPGGQDLQRRVLLQLEFRQGHGRPLGDVLQLDAIAQLVSHQHRIPLLKGLQEGLAGVDDRR